MTAYELFERVYKHYMGHFMGHLCSDGTNPKTYIMQSFNESLSDYSLAYAYNMGVKLSYSGNPADKNVADLRQIEVQTGYWLCYHDGHTGDWLLMYFDNKSGAKATYKRLYSKYFRHQDWYHTILVRGGTHQ